MKNKLFVLCVTVVGMFTLMGCYDHKVNGISEAIQQEREKTIESMEASSREVGFPNITEYTEKKLMKMLYELRDDSKLVTYSYRVNMEGKYLFIGETLGYGIPYSTQYTQPETMQRVSLPDLYHEDYREDVYTQPLPQADPNGLYNPTGLSATWVMLINPKTGDIEPAYIEEEVQVFMHPITKEQVEEWSKTGVYGWYAPEEYDKMSQLDKGEE